MTSFHFSYLPRAISANTVTLGVRDSAYEFGGLISKSIATGKLKDRLICQIQI